VTISYKAKKSGSDYEVSDATFKFNYTDFGVEKICKAVICVKPEVTVTVPSLKLHEG
jgi:hypothetical protein